MRLDYLERTLAAVRDALGQSAEAEAVARRPGWLQRLDSRVKCAGLAGWIAVGAFATRWEVPALLAALAGGLGLLAGIGWRRLLLRLWLPVLAFAGVVALPAVFLVPGPALAQPAGLTLSARGANLAALLTLRTLASVSLMMLLAQTTRRADLFHGLRGLGVPPILVALLAMTDRYMLLILEEAESMLAARRARTVGRLAGAPARSLLTGTAGALLDRSFALSSQVGDAMQARGFRGEFPRLAPRRPGVADAAAGVLFLAVAAGFYWWGRS